MLLGVAIGSSAQAAPVTYSLTSGTLDTVQLQDALNPLTTPTPCPIGSGNCLANPPLAITSASITLDTATSQLLNLSIFVAGPGTLNLLPGGFNGYDQIVFSNASYQSVLPTALFPNGGFAFSAPLSQPGQVSADITLFPTGGGSVGPIPYTATPTNGPSGTITFGEGGEIALNLEGVELGVFTGPLGVTQVKADFSLTAAVVPEPGAALLYGVGMLIAATSLRRRAAA
jgi:hypothetical protein